MTYFVGANEDTFTWFVKGRVKKKVSGFFPGLDKKPKRFCPSAGLEQHRSAAPIIGILQLLALVQLGTEYINTRTLLLLVITWILSASLMNALIVLIIGVHFEMAVILKPYPPFVLMVIHFFKRYPSVKTVRELSSGDYPFYPFVTTSTGEHFYCQYISTANSSLAVALFGFTALVLWMFYLEDGRIEQSISLFAVPVGLYCVYLFYESVVVHEVALELENPPAIKPAHKDSLTTSLNVKPFENPGMAPSVPLPSTPPESRPSQPSAATSFSQHARPASVTTATSIGVSATAGASSQAKKATQVFSSVNVLQYYVFRKHNLVAQGPPYNVFIKMHLKRLAFCYDAYYLSLEGFNIHPEKLIADDENVEKVRHLGRKLAERLGISYYDVHSISEHHQLNQASLKKLWYHRQNEFLETLRRRRDYIPRVRRLAIDPEKKKAVITPVVGPSSQALAAVGRPGRSQQDTSNMGSIGKQSGKSAGFSRSAGSRRKKSSFRRPGQPSGRLSQPGLNVPHASTGVGDVTVGITRPKLHGSRSGGAQKSSASLRNYSSSAGIKNRRNVS